ncbi:hypothetical protein VPH184E373B_0011 [Vibrio phage 184E37-3b]
MIRLACFESLGMNFLLRYKSNYNIGGIAFSII